MPKTKKKKFDELRTEIICVVADYPVEQSIAGISPPAIQIEQAVHHRLDSIQKDVHDAFVRIRHQSLCQTMNMVNGSKWLTVTALVTLEW